MLSYILKWIFQRWLSDLKVVINIFLKLQGFLVPCGNVLNRKFVFLYLDWKRNTKFLSVKCTTCFLSFDRFCFFKTIFSNQNVFNILGFLVVSKNSGQRKMFNLYSNSAVKLKHNFYLGKVI